MATKMKMVMKGGKSVPAFAADGKGKMQMGGVKKYQKGGTTTKKKVDNSITGKMQRGLDYLLGSDKLRAAGVSINNALKPYADKTRTTLNKALRPASPKVLMAKKQYGGSVDGPMEARRKIMGEKKPSLKKTLRYVKKNGSGYIPPNTKKMQYGGDNMSLGPVTDFTKIPRPASTTTPTPTPTPTPAPTSVKEAREQARIAKINAKAKGYTEGTIVPGRNTGRLIDAGVEGARLVNNAMESRRNPGGMKKGGATLKKATMKPKMQNGGSTRPIPGRTTNEPVDYSKMGQGLLPKGTVVDSYYSRNKNKIKKTVNKLKRLPLVKGFSRARNK